MTADPSTEHRRQTLLALAADVFGAGASVGCAPVAGADVSRLFPVEHSAVCTAIAGRRAEFAAGRIAARTAMGREIAIPMAADRAPIWPAGIAGSITHAGGWAMAVASRASALIGVDLELDEPLPSDIFDTVLSPREQAWIVTQPNPAHWARVIFSAKECAYKAQYPRSQRLFGFDVFEVVLNPDRARFFATFQQDIPPFAAGKTLQGRFSRAGGLILTGILA